MASQRCISKDSSIEKACRALIRAGWGCSRKGKHPKLVSPCGAITCVVPHSPSDGRSSKNWFAQLKRAGVVVPA